MSLAVWSDLIEICSDQWTAPTKKRVKLKGVLIQWRKEFADVFSEGSNRDKDKLEDHLVLLR